MTFLTDPIPHSTYLVIGALILMNIGAIGSMFWAAGRVIWYFAKQDSKIIEVRNLSIRAHKRLDQANTRIDNIHRRVDEMDEK